MPRVDITKNFERHRVASPARFVKFRTIDIGRPGASKMVIGKTKQGTWKPQSILIGRHENLYMKKKLRTEANKLMYRY